MRSPSHPSKTGPLVALLAAFLTVALPLDAHADDGEALPPPIVVPPPGSTTPPRPPPPTQIPQPARPPTPTVPAPAAPRPAQPYVDVLPPNAPREPVARIGMLLDLWDKSQDEGDVTKTRAIEARLRGEVDAAYSRLDALARGGRGLRLQNLAVSALGFSSYPQATRLLVARLAEPEERIRANALVALGIRKDPTTPLAPLVRFMDEKVGKLTARYAPLTFAHVLTARRTRLSAAEANEATRRLVALVKSNDGFTRLHCAKALGVVQTATAIRVLIAMTHEDDQMRVRWAAAAALERTGQAAGFPAVVRLLHEVAPASRPVIRDILIGYAARIQGAPLSAAEIEKFDVYAVEWSRWWSKYLRRLDEARAGRR